jgi:hypothetical protein
MHGMDASHQVNSEHIVWETFVIVKSRRRDP